VKIGFDFPLNTPPRSCLGFTITSIHGPNMIVMLMMAVVVESRHRPHPETLSPSVQVPHVLTTITVVVIEIAVMVAQEPTALITIDIVIIEPAAGLLEKVLVKGLVGRGLSLQPQNSINGVELGNGVGRRGGGIGLLGHGHRATVRTRSALDQDEGLEVRVSRSRARGHTIHSHAFFFGNNGKELYE